MAARDEIIVFDSLRDAEYGNDGNSADIRSWVEGVLGTLPKRDRRGRFTKDHVISFGQMARQNSESAMVGALLGAIDAKFQNGLNQIVAVDGAASVLANVGSLVLSGNEASKDMLNIGASCTTLYSFRKTKSLLKSLEGKTAFAGDPAPKKDPKDSIREMATQLAAE